MKSENWRPEAECDRPTRAALYRDAAIILADGKQDHTSAVRAFRHALQADSTVTIPDVHRTTKVNAAFDEARQVEGLSQPAPVVAAPPLTVAPEGDSESAPQVHDPRFLLHVVGAMKVGPTWGDRSNTATGQLSLETLGAHLGKTNAFIGGLLHADYNWFIENSSNWGSWGMARRSKGSRSAWTAISSTCRSRWAT